MNSRLTITLLSVATLAITAGCSSKPMVPPSKERRFFSVAFRQLPPDPVYNRLKLARLPEPLPPSDIQRASYSRMSPVFHFELKKTSLEQAARVLANLARYTSYTSSVIATRKIDLEGLGTIDELAEQISDQAGINVVIDHDNREVRFLANGTVKSDAAPADTGGRTAGATRAGRQFEAQTLNGMEASPLSPDKFSDEVLERLTGTKVKGTP